MQQTRLNLLLTTLINQCRNFVANPWRKLSFIIIGWLMGFTIPTVLTSSISQTGEWDTYVAFVFLLFTEFMIFLVYNKNNSTVQPWWRDIVNSFRIGFMYGLYLDGVILTS